MHNNRNQMKTKFVLKIQFQNGCRIKLKTESFRIPAFWSDGKIKLFYIHVMNE